MCNWLRAKPICPKGKNPDRDHSSRSFSTHVSGISPVLLFCFIFSPEDRGVKRLMPSLLVMIREREEEGGYVKGDNCYCHPNKEE